jgi:DNA segregation ATPase FtsK/SpoIIIE, S-DNA-T family
VRDVPEQLPEGRGLWADGGVEAQVALLAPDGSGAGQAEAVRELAARVAARDAATPRARQPFRLGALPASVPVGDLLAAIAERAPMWVPLAIGGDDLELLGLDLAASPVAMLAGPARSGRTSALRFVLGAAIARGQAALVICPRPSALADQARAAGPPPVEGVAGPLDDLVSALRGLPQGSLVLIDDAEMLREGDRAPAMQALIRQAREKDWGVVVAGDSAQLAGGLSGWLYEARRGRQGLLLSPQSLMDGEVVGARLSRSALMPRVQPGRGLLVGVAEEPVTVQVPWLAPAGLAATDVQPAGSRGAGPGRQLG